MITRADYGTFPPIMIEFLNYLAAIKNQSKLTISEYASDLRTFFRFIKVSRGLVPPTDDFENINISDINADFLKTITLSDAYAFLSYCKDDRDNNAKTRARKVSTLRSFFKYCAVQAKILDENPMQELDTPKLPKTLPKYLTLEQSQELLKHSATGKFKERDYCIVTMFLNCGLRLSELVSLNYTDIRDDGTMRVVGKGDKERTIYLNDACMDAIKNYMSVRPVDNVKDKQALFLSNRLQRISPKTVQHIVYTALEKSGLANQGFSVHKLRHTAATLMYQHGDVDVLVLKEILGHENLGTTQIYTHIVDEQLKNAVQSNPLSKEKLK